MTKTLGDLKGLLPTKLERGNGHETRCKCTVCFHSYGYAQAHDEISAIPILNVVKKAVESGAIVIKPCTANCLNGIITDYEGAEVRDVVCLTCSGREYVITEGEVSGG